MPWDQVLFYLIGAAAAVYVVRAFTGSGKKNGCGSCGGCGTQSACPSQGSPSDAAGPGGAGQLVQIEPAPPRQRQPE